MLPPQIVREIGNILPYSESSKFRCTCKRAIALVDRKNFFESKEWVEFEALVGFVFENSYTTISRGIPIAYDDESAMALLEYLQLLPEFGRRCAWQKFEIMFSTISLLLLDDRRFEFLSTKKISNDRPH